MRCFETNICRNHTLIGAQNCIQLVTLTGWLHVEVIGRVMSAMPKNG